MPELPDVTLYIEALAARVLGHVLERMSLDSPFLLRTAEPPLSSVFGQRVTVLRRLGKRIAIGFENDHWLIQHLMIAGRLHWLTPGTKRARAGRASRCWTSTAISAQRRRSTTPSRVRSRT